MYNFKKLKELRRKATTDEKMNGSFVRDVGVQPKDPQTAIQEHSLQELSKHKLARYQMKAAEKLRFKAVDHGAAIAQAAAAGGDMRKNDPDMEKRSRKLDKRIIGIGRAANKLTQKTNEETLDELEQKTYMSYLSKSRGRIKSKPSVTKSRGHAIKKTPKVHKRLFGDEQYEKQMKKMSEMRYRHGIIKIKSNAPLTNTDSKSKDKKEEKKKVRGVQKAINRINEDGHADVASALRKCKTIMEDASDIHTKLAMMGTMDSLPSWWTNKLAVAAAYMDSMRDYLLYPTNEEVEQLDELSPKTLGSYAQKSVRDLEKRDRAMGKATQRDRTVVDPEKSKPFQKMAKRRSGLTKAINRLSKEEVEQLDELSPKTLGSYAKKAQRQTMNTNMAIGANPIDSAATRREKAFVKKRKEGASRAIGKLVQKKMSNEEVKDQKYLKKLKQTKDQATLGDMSTGIQKGGFQGRGMYESKKVKTMKKVARDKLIGKKDPFEPEPNITTQVIRTDSPDNVVK